MITRDGGREKRRRKAFNITRKKKWREREIRERESEKEREGGGLDEEGIGCYIEKK